MDSFIFKYENTLKNVIITKYKDNCYMATSFFNKKDSELVEPVVSFIYFDGGIRTIEWSPPYGPISVNTKSEKHDNSRIDFFLGDAVNDWTQPAVDENNLNDKAINDIDGIFDVLERYK